MDANKKLQNPTNTEVLSNQTGLTPIQERAVSLLVAGKNYTDVANELKIDRSTLYVWADKITFIAYFNRLNKEIRDKIKNRLISMHEDALTAIKEGLISENPAIRHKTATWVLEKIEQNKIGTTDPRKYFRAMSTEDYQQIIQPYFDRSKYEELCRENGIEP